MARKDITTMLKARGATVWDAKRNTGWYLFSCEQYLYKAQSDIPFLSLCTGKFKDGFMLVVYFDTLK